MRYAVAVSVGSRPSIVRLTETRHRLKGQLTHGVAPTLLCKLNDFFARSQRLALRRFLDFFGEALREATLRLTVKSSSFAPAFNCSRSQTGCAPLPAHVFPDLSRYLTAIVRPFRGLRPSAFL